MKDATLLSRLCAGLLVALLGASLSGCYSKSTGYGGKFTFAYAAGFQFQNFVKPIAPGAKLDVVAFANGEEEETLTITAATSSKPGVLAVDSVAGKKLVVKGVTPGVAEIEITARDAAGKTLVDKMFFHVEKPTVHALQHACSDGPEAIYVEGSGVNIFHGLATSDARPVIGYAYMPIRVEPATALSLIAQPQGADVYMFRAQEKTERVTIRSTIDSSALSLRVVTRGELKEASLDCTGDCRTFEGYSLYVGADVRFGTTPVCNQNALTKARSLTPEICSVSAKLEDGDGSDTNREQLAVVKGLKFGICKYEMTLPELDGGKGIRLNGEAQIGRMQFPREREREGGQQSAERPGLRHLLEHTALPWFLVGLGWLAPNVIVLGCMAWVRRRRRRLLVTSG